MGYLPSLPDTAWTVTVAGMGGRAGEGGSEEELAKLEYERTLQVEETIEEAVRKAIRERLR